MRKDARGYCIIYLKKIENMYVGIINIYRPFFSFHKILNISWILKNNENKYTLKFILAIAKKIFNILQKEKKWLVYINNTNIHIFYIFQIYITF